MKYHKIITVWERNPETNHKTLIENKFANPELEYLSGNKWTFTEKVDGTNIRVIWDGENITFGGKTDNAQLYAPLFVVLQKMFTKEKMAKVFDFGNVVLYGEGHGAKIQKGGGNYNPDGVDFVLFDVRVGDIWLSRENVEDISANLDCPIVPIVNYGTLLEGIEIARSGYESLWRGFKAEGLVMRPETELLDRRGNRIITKIKYKDFKPITDEPRVMDDSNIKE